MRDKLVAYAQLCWERGWVANHDGNLSCRLSEDRFLATPTARTKRGLSSEELVVVDLEGRVLEGTLKLFSEWSLHAAIYRTRSAGAVIHTHAPYASAAGLVGLSLDSLPLPEAIVSLGSVPTAAMSAPGPDAAAELAKQITLGDAVLMPGNGAITLGADLEQAFLRAELVEHVAKILSIATPLGRVPRVPRALEAALLKKRQKAGLGPEVDAALNREREATLPAGARTARISGPQQTRRRALRAQLGAQTGDARMVDRVLELVEQVVSELNQRP